MPRQRARKTTRQKPNGDAVSKTHARKNVRQSGDDTSGTTQTRARKNARYPSGDTGTAKTRTRKSTRQKPSGDAGGKTRARKNVRQPAVSTTRARKSARQKSNGDTGDTTTTRTRKSTRKPSGDAGSATKTRTRSKGLWRRARRWLPGGVSSPVRAYGAVGGVPPFVVRGRGAHIEDADGNRYLDYVGSWGALALGHAPPSVVRAVQRAAAEGLGFGAPTEVEVELAAKICGALPSLEQVRFVSSGTEATMSALRLARAVTGRETILKFEGGYHGHADALLANAGSGVATQKLQRARARDTKLHANKTAHAAATHEHNEKHPAPAGAMRARDAELHASAAAIHKHAPPRNAHAKSRAGDGDGLHKSPGVPDALARLTLQTPYNDLPAARAVFQRHGAALAAVIVEPVAGNMGCVPPAPGFLEGVRELCDRHGALLIFDEVMTGFRVAWGGAENRYGVRPDLSCLGKVIGGGLPAAAYGGARALMAQLAPTGPVYQAGTLAGNPLAMAAGLATLRALEKPRVYERLERTSRALCDGLCERAAAVGVEFCAVAVGGMFGFSFGRAPVRNFADARAASTTRFRHFFHAMLEQGVYLAPSPFEAGFISLAHSPRDIRTTLDCAERAFTGIGRRAPGGT